MYDGRVVCCPLVSHLSMRCTSIKVRKEVIDGLTDTRPLNYIYRNRRGQRNFFAMVTKIRFVLTLLLHNHSY